MIDWFSFMIGYFVGLVMIFVLGWLSTLMPKHENTNLINETNEEKENGKRNRKKT